MWKKERNKAGNILDYIMYVLQKTQQLCLVIFLSMLLALIVYSPLFPERIDLAQASSALMVENGSQRLIGTAVSSTGSAENFAVIEDVQTRQQWIYREGALVGATLIKKILPDQIIVDNGSSEVVVKLQRSLRENNSGGGRGITSSSSAVKPKRDPTKKGGSRDRYYLINGEVFAAAFANPEQLLETAGMKPGKGLGRQIGVRLGDFPSDSIFSALGLRKRDLLLAVDGQNIVDPGQAVANLQTMLDDGQAELKIKRRLRTYRFHLQAE